GGYERLAFSASAFCASSRDLCTSRRAVIVARHSGKRSGIALHSALGNRDIYRVTRSKLSLSRCVTPSECYPSAFAGFAGRSSCRGIKHVLRHFGERRGARGKNLLRTN